MRRKPLLTYRGPQSDWPTRHLRKASIQEAFLLCTTLTPKFSQPISASAEQQVNDHKRKNEAKATTAVITDTGPHIVAAAAE
jgi:hypothetical protein